MIQLDFLETPTQAELPLVVEHAPTKLQRVANDFYPTPNSALIVQALTDRVRIQGTVFEPCAGDGAIASQFPGCLTNEPHPQPGIYPDYLLDTSDRRDWRHIAGANPIHWTITNPPFNLAHLILPLAFEYSAVGVAFLLRLSYAEPTSNRGEWLQQHADHLTHVIALNPRPKFRGDTAGTDSVTCAWFVWQKGWSWKQKGIDCPFGFATGEWGKRRA